jgi:cyclic pyranopterin phosphate synthase
MAPHIDEKGNALMVDVSDKNTTQRTAVAEGRIIVGPRILEAVRLRSAAKGDALSVAQLAGIMGAKRTADLIPLCHPLPLTGCRVTLELGDNEILARCTVKTQGRTGVEMEALTGVSVALLTVYDMCKGMDKGMEIHGIRLLEKSGGKSGDYRLSGRPESL